MVEPIRDAAKEPSPDHRDVTASRKHVQGFSTSGLEGTQRSSERISCERM